MDYAKRVADFVVETNLAMVPPKAIEVAKTAIVDCIGVTLAGSREKSARICGLLVRGEGAGGESTVIGQGFKASALMAALANGTSSHALDYDHSFVVMGQPMAPLVPAIFSLGEALRVRGRDLVLAYTVGFEVTAKLARSIPEHSVRGGWHATGTLGTIGATAACAKLLRLDAAAVQMALGIASSMASGIVSNFGSMTKPLHPGLAAKNGVLAAKLARGGFTSNSQIFERPKGFFHAFARGMPFDGGPLEGLGREFDLAERGIRIKPYPCGGLTHSAVDALLEMGSKHGIRPEGVEKIHVGVTQHTYGAIVYHQPETGLQGKFSMPYILARALIQGRLRLEDFTDRAVRDASARELAKKITMEHDPEMKEGADGGRPSRVAISLKDGRTFSHRVDYAKGGSEVPMSPEEIRGKFMECAGRVIGKKAAGRVLDYLDHLERLRDLKPLCRLLLGKR